MPPPSWTSSWTASWARSSTDRPTVKRRVTARAVVVGVLAGLAVAVLAPLNDWVWRNPPLFGLYLPLCVTMLLLGMALVVNPLLGRRRFLVGELVTVSVILLVLGGVVSSGLARVLPGMVAGPAKVVPVSPHLAALGDQGGGPALPPYLFLQMPAKGPITADSLDYGWQISGFFIGAGGAVPTVGYRSTVRWRDEDGTVRSGVALPGGSGVGMVDIDRGPGRAMIAAAAGQTVRWRDDQGLPHQATVEAVTPPPVPWAAWVQRLLAWGPLVVGSWLCCLALAAIVRRQWTENERLPFPIARFTYDLMQEPAPGRRVAELFHRRSFWLGALIAFGTLGGQALVGLGWLPWAPPVDFDYRAAFAGEPWNGVYDANSLYRLHLSFTVLGLVFLLPGQIGFSLWGFVVLTGVVYAVLRAQGVPVAWQHAGEAGVGGWAMACLLVLWVGRRHYLAVLRAAVAGSDEPAISRVRHYVWMLLGGVVLIAVWLVWLGAVWWHALVAVVLFLGFALMLARIVAEAGVPFVGLPAGCHASQLLYAVVGVHAPLAALAPLALVGATVLGDGREHVLPYAVEGEYLANRALPRATTAARLGWTGLLFAALAVGALVAVGVLVAAAYRGDGWSDGRWYGALFGEGLTPMLSAWQAHANDAGPARPADLLWTLGAGAAIVAVLSMCRWAFAWWPLHPIGYLVSMTPPAQAIWFGCFLGWLAKTLVMRYGGARVYVHLRPLAYGLVAGEAVAAGLFLVVSIICQLAGVRVPVMPGIIPT